MVYVPELPSAMVRELSETETPAPSSSVMFTVVVVVVPRLTPPGSSVPKPRSLSEDSFRETKPATQ